MKNTNRIDDIIDILACPICKGKLVYNGNKQQLICNFDKLAYPIQNGIPNFIVENAIKLNKEK
jgi:hypothetical protein